MTTNEAADRLDHYLSRLGSSRQGHADLEEALSEERRAAVNHVRERLFRDAEAHRGGELVFHWATTYDILEEEAAR